MIIQILVLALAFLPASRRVVHTPSSTTFAVTNTADSGAGSLRQAIVDADANPGLDTITFNIPGSGVHTIVVGGVILTVNDPVTIDATTQPGYNGKPLLEIVGHMTLLGGSSTLRGVAIYSPFFNGFPIDTLVLGREMGSTIQPVNGGNLVEACYIGLRADGITPGPGSRQGITITSPGNRIGGTAPSARNVISGNHAEGILIVPSSPTAPNNNVIQGNFIGTDATGTVAVPNGIDGIAINGGSFNTIGGTTSGAGNLISGNGGAGIRIDARNTGMPQNNNVIQGNFIGTDITGNVAVPNGSDGIILRPGEFPSMEISNNLIGGTTPSARNLISGNNNGGIWLGYGNVTANLIQGNYIGTKVDGVSALGNGYAPPPGANHIEGIFFEGPGAGTPTSGPSNNVVGGFVPGAGNVVAYSAGSGVTVIEAYNNVVAGNTIFANVHAGIALGFLAQRTNIRRNSIFNNTNLGIDIIEAGPREGPSANDHCDPDAGFLNGNNRQNFPDLIAATSNGSSTLITGTLDSLPNTTFTLEFFSSPSPDASGFGEGKAFLGSATVTTGANCIADFSSGITVPAPTGNGHYVTATATDPDGNTSEFSEYKQATGMANQPPTAADDNYAVNQGAVLNIPAPGVLGNDSDPDPGTTLTAVAVTGPANGTLGLNTNGSFTYSPNVGFNGTDTFRYKANDGIADSNTATASITVNPQTPAQANIEAQVSAEMPLGTPVSSIVVGQTVLFRVNILNFGPQNATGVLGTVTITGSTGTVLNVVVTPTGLTCTPSGAAFDCTVATIIGNSEWLMSATPTTPGTLTVTLNASANEFDPNLANNTASAQVTVAPKTANIQAQVSAEMPLGTPVSSIVVGQTVLFRVNILNFGPQNATGVLGTVTITGSTGAVLTVVATPTGLSCAPNGAAFDCTVATIIGNSEWLMSATPTTPGTLTVTLNASANEFDPNLANNTASAQVTVAPKTANIQAQVSAEMPLGTPVPSIVVGQTVLFRVNILNFGPQNATGVLGTVTITGSTGAVLTVVATPTGLSCAPNGAAFDCTVATIIGNSEWLMSATPTTAGALTVTLNTSSDEFDPNLANNTASAQVTVLPASSPFNTLVGPSVNVQLGAMAVNFANVTAPGNTTVRVLTPSSLLQPTGPSALPPGFVVFNNLAFDISTTATVTGPITIAFDLSGLLPNATPPINAQAFSTLRVLHGEIAPSGPPVFVDRTANSGPPILPNSPSALPIFARLSSLSPFIIGQLSDKIVFSSSRNGNFEIYAMKSDGSGVTRLTNHPASDLFPAWSPDHQKIAFTSDRDGNFEIYSMNADGSAPVRLTVNGSVDGGAAWSPDGTKIAFTSSRNGNLEIYSMNANGSGLLRLTNNSAADSQPSWSPDGSKIAFTSARSGNVDIYSMNASGTGATRLTTSSAIDLSPAWSPDGKKIAFSSNRSNFFNFDIYVMDAEGSSPARLTSHIAADGEPAWSRDGARILFSSNREGLLNFDLYVVNSEGVAQTRLTTSSASDNSPHWY